MAKLCADLQAIGGSGALMHASETLTRLETEFDLVRDRLADELPVGKQSPS
jgi:hypothetical protein